MFICEKCKKIPSPESTPRRPQRFDFYSLPICPSTWNPLKYALHATSRVLHKNVLFTVFAVSNTRDYRSSTVLNVFWKQKGFWLSKAVIEPPLPIYPADRYIASIYVVWDWVSERTWWFCTVAYLSDPRPSGADENRSLSSGIAYDDKAIVFVADVDLTGKDWIRTSDHFQRSPKIAKKEKEESSFTYQRWDTYIHISCKEFHINCV